MGLVKTINIILGSILIVLVAAPFILGILVDPKYLWLLIWTFYLGIPILMALILINAINWFIKRKRK